MGGSISVTNKSEVYINVALKQVGVLHWRNGLAPGETVTWQLGRVWVTVEAIVDDITDGRSQYRELDRVLPIVLATGGAIAVAGGAVIAAGPALVGGGIATAAALGSATVAAETAGAAATAATVEGILGTGGATAVGAATGAAAGAFTREVAGIFGKKAVGTAADIAVDTTVGAISKRNRMVPHLVKARKYGVFAGNSPKLVVTGNSRYIEIDYETEASEKEAIEKGVSEKISDKPS